MVYPSSEWRQQSQCWQRQRETALQGALSFPMASLWSAFVRWCVFVYARLCVGRSLCVFTFRKGCIFSVTTLQISLAEKEYDYCFSAKNRGVLC